MLSRHRFRANPCGARQGFDRCLRRFRTKAGPRCRFKRMVAAFGRFRRAATLRGQPLPPGTENPVCRPFSAFYALCTRPDSHFHELAPFGAPGGRETPEYSPILIQGPGTGAQPRIEPWWSCRAVNRFLTGRALLGGAKKADMTKLLSNRHRLLRPTVIAQVSQRENGYFGAANLRKNRGSPA